MAAVQVDAMGASYFNTSALAFAPSARDLLLVVPRLARRAGAFAISHLPGPVDTFWAVARNTGSSIAEATPPPTLLNTTILPSGSAIAEAAAASSGPVEAAGLPGLMATVNQAFSLQNMRGFGGVFSYMTSKWAISTFAVAIILNRTSVYTLTRHHLRFSWKMRLFLRVLPVVVFTLLAQRFLQVMRCQTSPQFAQLRYEEPGKRLLLDFAGGAGFIYRLSSSILFWQDDAACCSASGLVGNKDPREFQGSLSVLWPFFVSLCFSQFVETLSCALQGRQTMPDTGMTIFEHSLAIAEAEAMISHAAGLLRSSSSRVNSAIAFNATRLATQSSSPAAAAAPLLDRYMILYRLNAPPELLLIAFISILSHVSNHVLSIFDLQARFRLVNTTIWGLCFMAALIWSFTGVMQSHDDVKDLGMLRFPTVCIVGFIPHMLIIIGIFVCSIIYACALAINMLSPPPGQSESRSFVERIKAANGNLQANVQLSSIRISWQEDFYSTLLKVGFAMLTAASEAVYFNESLSLRVSKRTWLEEKRLQEFTQENQAYRRVLSTIPSQVLGNSLADGIGLVDELDKGTLPSDPRIISGYARERKTQNVKGGAKLDRIVINDDGVGAMQRGGRWILAGAFMKGILWLYVGVWARATVAILRKAGFRRRIPFLEKYAMPSRRQKKVQEQQSVAKQSLDFYMISDEGNLVLPPDRNVDIEAEWRTRLQPFHTPTYDTERKLDEELYSWWKRGGWWGEIDTSGDFQPPEPADEDTTSLSSDAESIAASLDDWGINSADTGGRRTPTQRYPYSDRDDSPFEDAILDTSHLAHLLDPHSSDDREEARILASHLDSDRVMTRGQYRRRTNAERGKILTSSRPEREIFGSSRTNPAGALTPEEEEQLLEQIILARRQDAAARSAHTFASTADGQGQSQAQGGTSWDAGAAGMGDAGPQCVVCQSSPRTVLVWPCRCLSLCEECRINLALKNFGSCVCCRRDVVAFSRLFVP